MKKVDAFALRGFNPHEFIQAQMSASGLSNFSLSKPDGNANDFDDLQRARQAYLHFGEELAKFRQRLIRHIDRLGRYQATLVRTLADATDDFYQNTLRPKSKRAVALSDQYAAVAKTINDAEVIATNMRDRIDIAQRNMCLKIFAGRLKEARKSLGLTQEALGKVFGVTQRAISNYEKAMREPSLAMLKILAQLSNRPVDWFLNL